ncbi:Sec-independent protein translocase subunit TatA [Cellulomonas denverensis]|uniref:Sec-independent protein translocase protein TatA n=1 Tax=Cellulomonas denverensis TaxID=264297 RepID=A0A7X6QYE3_9CELL|nr:Sec-independent protein translocase subunit TatA [Cellulomonas denverensis]NKY21911.1 Sec-independent protein translocase subunit TatA [Cellulomonas denverensis]GIG24199.1 hypothetical protein Cde04nite_04430 [Cellulomonas denverensis]
MLGNAIKPWHIVVLVIVIVLLFGAKRLPDLAKSVGQSLKIFKNEVKDLTTDDKDATVQPGGTTSAPTAQSAPSQPVQQPGSTTHPPSGGSSNTPS